MRILGSITFLLVLWSAAHGAQLSNYADLEKLRTHPVLSRAERIDLLGQITRMEISLEPTFIVAFFGLNELFGDDFSLRLQFQRLAYNKVRDAFILELATVASAADPRVRVSSELALIKVLEVVERYFSDMQYEAFVQQLYSFEEFLGTRMKARLSSTLINPVYVRSECQSRLMKLQ